MTEVSDFSAGGNSIDSDGAATGHRFGASSGTGGGHAAQLRPDPAGGGTEEGGLDGLVVTGAGGWSQGLSFASGKGCHDSVRVVIPDRGAFACLGWLVE